MSPFINEVVAYKTSDGQFFEDYKEALEHVLMCSLASISNLAENVLTKRLDTQYYDDTEEILALLKVEVGACEQYFERLREIVN